MQTKSNAGITGAALIGVGCGLTAAGLVLVIPACMNWSAGLVQQAIRQGRESVGNAASSFGEFAGKTQARFDDAARSAKATTARAAEVVEHAARNVKEYTS